MLYLAHHDRLTDLPNRVLLHDRLTRAGSLARRPRRQMAVLFLDISTASSTSIEPLSRSTFGLASPEAWAHPAGTVCADLDTDSGASSIVAL
jgi:hypothetical protein